MIYLKLVLTAMFWGGAFVAGRTATAQGGAYSIAFLRFLSASLLLVLIMRKVEGGFPPVAPRHLPAIVLLGLTGIAAYNVFFFKGLAIIAASRAALIVATCPVFISLFSSLFLKERLGIVRVAGIVLSVTGAIIVISKGDPRGLLDGKVGWGEAFIFGCVLCWTVYSLIGKVMMKELSSLALVTYSSLAGTIGLLWPAWREGLAAQILDYSPKTWLCILYMGVCGTVIGFVWYYQGVRKIGAVKAGLFINFVPVWAILFSFLILGEKITASLFAGAILVISGVYLTNRTTRKNQTQDGKACPTTQNA